jgi:hypothetical protein
MQTRKHEAATPGVPVEIHILGELAPAGSFRGAGTKDYEA